MEVPEEDMEVQEETVQCASACGLLQKKQ